MKVPLTTRDFFDRAESVYGPRRAVVDEPEAPGGGLGELTWSRYAELGRAQAARLDELGIGFGDRVAMLSQNAASEALESLLSDDTELRRVIHDELREIRRRSAGERRSELTIDPGGTWVAETPRRPPKIS